jgi:BMFP domain-containing protein YqiC
MKPDFKILDDLARMAGGAVNIASSLQQQVREDVKSRVDEVISRMDVVPREDFEKLEAMVSELRKEQIALKAQISDLLVINSSENTVTSKETVTPRKAKAVKAPKVTKNKAKPANKKAVAKTVKKPAATKKAPSKKVAQKKPKKK